MYPQAFPTFVLQTAKPGQSLGAKHETGGETVSNESLIYLELEVDSISSDPYKMLLCKDGIRIFVREFMHSIS